MRTALASFVALLLWAAPAQAHHGSPSNGDAVWIAGVWAHYNNPNVTRGSEQVVNTGVQPYVYNTCTKAGIAPEWQASSWRCPVQMTGSNGIVQGRGGAHYNVYGSGNRATCRIWLWIVHFADGSYRVYPQNNGNCSRY